MAAERVSASKFGLARKCVYPWTSGLEFEKRVGWSGAIGTAGHLAAETGALPTWEPVKIVRGKWRNADGLTKRQVEIIRGVSRQYQKWLAANLDDMEGARHEVPLWYCPDTGECGELTRGEHRDYSKAPPGAFCMTVDLVGYGRWDFADIKTGWAPSAPDDSDQMRLIGLVISKLRGKSEVEAGILALREREHTFMPATLDELTLGVVEREAKRVHLAVRNKQGPTPGDHCKWCPVRETCKESTYGRTDERTGQAEGKSHAA